MNKLEHLAVYGRASIGKSWLLDYYRFAFCVLAAFSPNHAKFCGDQLKNARDIRNQKFVLPEKVGQSSPKSFKTCCPLRLPIMPNFIEIGQTSLEKSVTEIGLWTKKNYFVTDGQNVNYLSRASQHARGATKNVCANLFKAFWVLSVIWSFSSTLLVCCFFPPQPGWAGTRKVKSVWV